MFRRFFSGALFYVMVVCFGTADSASAGVMVYTNKAAWESAVSGQFLTEDFADKNLNAGVTYTSSESSHINEEHGYFQGVLTSTSGNSPFTIWSFSPQIRAYGGNWTLGGPGGSGNSLLVYIGDDFSFKVGKIDSDFNGGFWGFISDTSFAQVKLIGGTGTNQQTYKLDDMVYSSVPEPASVCLLVTGMIGTLVLARRRSII
jgi:hypothetical protein